MSTTRTMGTSGAISTSGMTFTVTTECIECGIEFSYTTLNHSVYRRQRCPTCNREHKRVTVKLNRIKNKQHQERERVRLKELRSGSARAMDCHRCTYLEHCKEIVMGGERLPCQPEEEM